MADDAILKVSTQVDLGPLKAGMADAAATVTSTTSQMASSIDSNMARCNAATAALNAALNTASAEGVNLIHEAFEKAAASGATMTEAAEAATAAFAAYTPVVEEAAAATMSASSAMNAARLGAGAMTGSSYELAYGLARAGAASSVLGPVLEAAFPVLVAGAMIDVVADLGEKVYELYENYISLDGASNAFYKTLSKEVTKDFVNVDNIEDATKRLNEATGAIKDFRDVAESLHQGGLTELLHGNLAGGMGELIGAGGKGASGDAVQKQQQSIALEDKKLTLQHQLNEAALHANLIQDQGLTGLQKINAEEKDRLAIIAENRSYSAQKDRLMGNPGSSDAGAALQEQQDRAVKAQAGNAAATYEAEAAHKAEEAQERMARAAEQAARRQEEAARRLQQAARAAQEAEKEAQIHHYEIGKSMDSSLGKSDSSINSQATEQMNQSWKKEMDAAQAQIEAARLTADAWKQQQDAKLQSQEQAVKGAHGSPKDTATQLQALNDQKLAVQQAYFQSLEALYANNAAKVQQLQNQMAAAAEQHAMREQQITQQMLQQEQKQYQQYFNSVNQGFGIAINGMIQDTQNMEQIWGHALDSMIVGMAEYVAKYLEKKAEMWIMDEILGKTSQTTTAISQITSNAAVAASAAYASTAAIPVVGVAAAPAAAGEAYTSVLAMISLASAAGGYDVPAGVNPVTQLHQNEMVLPSHLADKVRNMTGGGGNTSVTQNFHGVTDPAEFVRQMEPHLAKSMKRMGRNGVFGK